MPTIAIIRGLVNRELYSSEKTTVPYRPTKVQFTHSPTPRQLLDVGKMPIPATGRNKDAMQRRNESGRLTFQFLQRLVQGRRVGDAVMVMVVVLVVGIVR